MREPVQRSLFPPISEFSVPDPVIIVATRKPRPWRDVAGCPIDTTEGKRQNRQVEIMIQDDNSEEQRLIELCCLYTAIVLILLSLPDAHTSQHQFVTEGTSR